MNTFSQAVATSKSQEIKRTENGMKAFATTDSKVLDLFSKIGSSRGQPLDALFHAALAEDEDKTLRILLWVRDIRGGSGERQTFRTLLAALEKFNPALAGKIMHKVPELGRWDDLFVYSEPMNRKAALRMYADALMDGQQLAGKWAPRLTSSKKANTPGKLVNLKNANDLRKFMMLSPKEYRELLVKNTNVVEQKMCAKEWNEINFSHVPSVASARYQKAFGKNASEAYGAYIRELQKPQEERDVKVKINAGAIFPYDVVKSVQKGNAAVADAQFEALPDFVGENRILPIIDTSASMTWVEVSPGVQPFHVAMSLGLYLSSKTSSDFKDMVMHFSDSSSIEVLKGTLSQKLTQMQRMIVHGSTNLHAAFNVLLNTALKGKVAQENMPTHLLILSDMEFNGCVRYDDSAVGMIKRKYDAAGYKMPKIIFWNLNSRNVNGSTPVKVNDKGIAIVSGFSPAIMASVLGSDPDNFSPWNMMLTTIMNDRYSYEKL